MSVVALSPRRRKTFSGRATTAMTSANSMTQSLAACARELARNPSGITNSTSPPGLAN